MNLGGLRRLVTLEQPTRTADGDGGFTQTWTALSPSPVAAAVEQANANSLDKLLANATVTQATKVVRLRFHPQVTQQTRVSWTDGLGAHVANVTNIIPDAKNVELILVCAELTE
jgi:head-tail adaptor